MTMLEKLPKGWVETTLGKIAEPSRERVLPEEAPELRYIGLEHIEPQTMKRLGHRFAREIRSSSVRFRKGDVLYGKMRPYLNKVWVAEFEGLCSAEFLVFPKRNGLNSQFLAFRFNAEDFVAFANGQVSGERPRIDFEKLSHFPIQLPPATEQQRIAAKLNDALSAVVRAEAAAHRAQERLVRYRAAVLEAAVIGELTRTWRDAQSKDGNLQNGEVVLERLLATRRDRWEQAELKRLRGKGKIPKDDQWKSRYPEPVRPDVTDLPNLPETWVWTSLEAIAEIGSGISVSQNRLVQNAVELPYLRVANVLRGYLDLSEMKTIRVEKDRVSAFLLHVGDILFNEGGDRDKLGRGWIWEGQLRECVHQNHVFRARPIDSSLVNAKLVSHWGNTFGQRFFLKYGTQTTNLASINQGVLSKLPVPIAPIDEQAEILFEVTRRLEAADGLASSLERQLSRAHVARESLLREAFAGNLVPQDPDEGSASALLESMRVAREAETQKKKAKQMPKPKPKMKVTSRRRLLEVLKENGGLMTPEELFQASGHSQESVDEFFAELRELTATPPQITEERRDGGVTLLKVAS